MVVTGRREAGNVGCARWQRQEGEKPAKQVVLGRNDRKARSRQRRLSHVAVTGRREAGNVG